VTLHFRLTTERHPCNVSRMFRLFTHAFINKAAYGFIYEGMSILLLLIFPSVAISVEISREPLPVMQQNPAMMRYYDPRPSSAQVLGADNGQFRLDQHYTSIFLADTLPDPGRYLADMELD